MSNDQHPMTNIQSFRGWSLAIGHWSFPLPSPCLRGSLLLLITSLGCSTSASSNSDSDSPSNVTALPPVEIELAEGQAVTSGKGNAHFDEQSGQMGMLALSCSLPDCPGKGEDGQPYLFCRISSGEEQERKSSGEAPSTGDITVTWGRRIVAPMRGGMLVCPACGRNEGMHHYEPPQVTARRTLLEEELKLARAARRAANQAGEPMPSDHRTPAAIMHDLSNLPKVYLLPEKTSGLK